MSWLEFALMTAFNATICILLPRLITLDWGKLAQSVLKKENSVPPQPSQVSRSESRRNESQPLTEAVGAKQ
ncbi:MAG: hypothetical protein ABEI32_15830 [Halothece sp.]|jgi:hypothetical protein